MQISTTLTWSHALKMVIQQFNTIKYSVRRFNNLILRLKLYEINLYKNGQLFAFIFEKCDNFAHFGSFKRLKINFHNDILKINFEIIFIN